ncbi:MAG: RidA family protein, partial [Tabrizicola sp.]|nr:RidA family protein [Tabrizicola sp.]
MNNDITRYGVGPRMSEAVSYNGIVWVAGQLGEPTGT